MCYNLPIYYKIKVEYTPNDIEGIRETDSRFYDIVEDFKDCLDGGGSGFGFGIRDLDFDFATKETAEKVYSMFKLIGTLEVMKESDVEVYLTEVDNYECYLDVGCDDCYFKGETDEK